MPDPDPVVTNPDDDGRTWYARLVGGGLLLIPLLLIYLLVALWPRPQGSINCAWQNPKEQEVQEETAARDDTQPEASPTPAVTATADEISSSEAAQPTESPAEADVTPPEESTDDTTRAAEDEEKNREDWAEQWAPCASVRPLIGEFQLLADVRLLILVLIAGAIGAYVHAAQSYASYIGNQKFKKQWTWWYLLRIPVGSALALFVYFTARGGLLTGTTPASKTDDLNLFGIMAFAALSGLFSKQVIDKLAEVFSNFFKSEEDAKRRDKYDESKGGNSSAGGADGTASGSSGTTGTSGGAGSGTGASGSTGAATGTSGSANP